MIAIRLLQLTFTALPCSQWDSPGHIFALQKVQLSQVGPIQFCLDTANWYVGTSYMKGVHLFPRLSNRSAVGGDGDEIVPFSIAIEPIGTRTHLPAKIPTANDFYTGLKAFLFDGATSTTTITPSGVVVYATNYSEDPNLIIAIKALTKTDLVQIHMGYHMDGVNSRGDYQQFNAVLSTLEVVRRSYPH